MNLMARPRTPTKILELKGAFKKNPQRERNNEPEPTKTLGNYPANFKSKKLKAIWDELADNFALGNLGNSDRLALETLCILVDGFRSDPKEFSSAKLGRMTALISLFGGTPSDRAKLNVPKTPKKNPFSEI